MGQCTFISKCPLFNADPAIVGAGVIDDYRRRFCEGNKVSCARYLVATSVGPDKVPVDLGPEESARALKILRSSN